ncbi:hypothetical protein ACIBBB_35800 [Streptomyces sp. NPDC051217]|uniref:hypothetical protein n=1 Tax=Streptomyces sp. NPDC051217 TaxID=3365644 RepID=UPI00379C9D18
MPIRRQTMCCAPRMRSCPYDQGGPAVPVPGEFVDAGHAPDALDAQAGAELAGAEVGDEGPRDGLMEAAGVVGV